jgi:hypothetical protein
VAIAISSAPQACQFLHQHSAVLGKYLVNERPDLAGVEDDNKNILSFSSVQLIAFSKRHKMPRLTKQSRVD